MDAKSEWNDKPHERGLVLTRVFNARPEILFKCWTDPKHLAAWWGPEMFTNPVVEVDARVGGKLRIVMRGPQGTDHPMGGVFKEVEENKKLVFTNIAYNADGTPMLEGLTTVTFEDTGDGRTKLKMETHVAGSSDQAAMALKGMDMGWMQSLDKLGKYLKTTVV